MSDERYPLAAGHRGLGGSVAAAKRVTPSLPRLQALVVAVIEAAGSYGATGDEIAAALGWDKYRVRPRTAELRAAGKIVDSRKRRKSETGIASIVWTTPAYSQSVVSGGAA